MRGPQAHSGRASPAGAEKGEIPRAHVRAQPRSKAPDIPAESNHLQLSTRRVGKLNRRGKCAGVPAPGIIVNGTELRSGVVVTQRNTSKPVIGDQGQATRDLGGDVGGN